MIKDLLSLTWHSRPEKDEEFHIYSTSYSFSNNIMDYIIGSNRWGVTVV